MSQPAAKPSAASQEQSDFVLPLPRQLIAPAPTTERAQPVKLDVNFRNQLAYANNKTVFLIDLKQHDHLTNNAQAYTEHLYPVSACSFTPSGYYCSSGDQSGQVRIWDVVQPEHITKYSYDVFNGAILDIAWNENDRLIIGGDGKEEKVKGILWHTGTTIGEFPGHSKRVNSVSHTKSRPFKAFTASDDQTVNCYSNIPYVYQLSLKDHQRFISDVNCNSTLLLSAGFDGLVNLYPLDKIGKIESNGKTSVQCHDSAIMSLGSSDTQFCTASLDKSIKLFDIATLKCIKEYQITTSTTAINNQQMGLCFNSHTNGIYSVSLDGTLNFMDPRIKDPMLVNVVNKWHNHCKPITSIYSTKDVTFWTASYDGRVVQWKNKPAKSTSKPGTPTASQNNLNSTSPPKSPLSPTSNSGNGIVPLSSHVITSHTNQVVSIKPYKSAVVTVGMDDLLINHNETPPKSLKIQGLAKSLSIYKDFALIASSNGIQSVDLVKMTLNMLLKGDYSCIASLGEYTVLGIDNKAIVYKTGDLLTRSAPLNTFTVKGKITCCLITPDMEYIATGSSERQVALHNIQNGQTIVDQWVFHSSKVTCLSSSPIKINGNWSIVSGSVDGIIMINKVDKPLEPVKVQPAHQEGVNCVEWIDVVEKKRKEKKDGEEIVFTDTVCIVKSTGGDATIKVWEIVF
eukprot:NODE_158_length_16653_cov_0.456929.p1 type:complete len:681 gc:universal NODE_158_length_16653_cov_0.456929:1547-3589(+)